MKNQIQSITGFQFTENIGNYIDIPLLNERVSKRLYGSVLEKVQQRLTGWKAKHLSLAGRCTLVQSILAGIPIYVMQTAWLPQATCDALNKLNRNFILG